MNPTAETAATATTTALSASGFNPGEAEREAQALWQQSEALRTTLEDARANFSILLPPPNVTGSLHMGHAFNQTVMDTLTRWQRMKGANTLWLPGTDHAGIATQIVVERQLQSQGLTRQQLGREEFLRHVWRWKEQSGSTILAQMQRLGASAAWDYEYFTMDAPRSAAVIHAFVQLYEAGLIYRGRRLVNWDPALKSAVSDLEVETQEREGQLYFIRYPFSGGAVAGQSAMLIATTRPETLLGDSALAVHPEDERYRALIGREVELPLCNRRIPIIADTFVEREFGTGCVKITGAHDFNDYAASQRHDLPLHSILDAEAKVCGIAPPRFHGLDRYAARAQILTELRAAGLLQEVKPHRHHLPICTRSGQVVEPMLTDQWFMAMNKPCNGRPGLADRALDALQSGDLRLIPEGWRGVWRQWLENIQDWCLSRQLWWGHQIPAWHGSGGEIFVAQSAEAAREQAERAGYRGELTRDPDVLDTWFSSALLPLSALGWPQALGARERFLPSNVLITGHDILFFWVARMVMMTLFFRDEVPFREVYLHGLVRDAQGNKMSKSEGNVLDPVDLIDGIALEPLLIKRAQGLRRPELAPQVQQHTRTEFPQGIAAYGADALRMTFASLASLGRNINFSAKRCEGYRNFCNKLFNATRFALMQAEPLGGAAALADFKPEPQALAMPQRWIISELQRTEQAVEQALSDYRLDLAMEALYRFLWDEVCDWYLEMSKTLLAAQQPLEQRRAACVTLLRVLEAGLRLLHPIAPFITEGLWQRLAPLAGKKRAHEVASIANAPYPRADLSRQDAQADAAMAQCKAWVIATRNLRAQMKLAPSERVPLLALAPPEVVPAIDAVQPYWQSLARLSEIRITTSEAEFAAAARQAPVASAATLRLALIVQIDVAAERARLSKEREKLQQAIERARHQLDNPAFSQRASAEIVEQHRARLNALQEEQAQCEEQLRSLGS